MTGREWPRIDVSMSQIRRAGGTLRNPAASSDERSAARKLAGQWRAAHAYPTNTWQIRVRRYVSHIPEALVAQRMKRLPSIEAKLQRFRNSQLHKMQDLGGVRVVLPKLDDVRELERKLLDRPNRHTLVKHTDYLMHPKDDGYRSIHLVYAYGTASPGPWEGYSVEIQLRTKAQHLWATALETVALFTNQKLKAGSGDDWWRRFFALMSAEIATAEGLPLTPGTPDSSEERRNEIWELELQHEILARLRGFRHVVAEVKEGVEGASFVLLDLDLNDYMLETTGFSDREEATRAYAALEAETRGDEDRDVVLVAVDGIGGLAAAYPNYFVDLDQFIDLTMYAMAVKRPGEENGWAWLSH
ncbi:RelA/SpoT domain-containing protein [Curtobacterium sp. BRB10]|uniref:RelA/SpoT domain-containing protein n=1 Tax=Curtobacterium sp. BRB10 TaxID=2962579 RepID=UPI002882BF79|nr:RelA/SpoT domain-containing protein [Curtobacterium sp. BRB10]MDT0235398.1 RelA/SpoT domain-containing protein [Curtobacterium sp. BRB10]